MTTRWRSSSSPWAGEWSVSVPDKGSQRRCSQCWDPSDMLWGKIDNIIDNRVDITQRDELFMYGAPGYTLCILVFEKWWEFETWQEKSHVPFDLITKYTFFFHFPINILSVNNYFSNAIHLSILWNIARQWNTCLYGFHITFIGIDCLKWLITIGNVEVGCHKLV